MEKNYFAINAKSLGRPLRNYFLEVNGWASLTGRKQGNQYLVVYGTSRITS